jgi:hypothetical protein
MKKDLGLFEQTENLLFVTKQELAIALYSGCYIDPRIINETAISVPLSVELDPMNIYEGAFPAILLEKASSDSKFEYPIGIRISSLEKTILITDKVRRLENRVIPLQSFESIVFQSVEDETDFLETSGQFIFSNGAKSLKREIDPNPFIGYAMSATSRELAPSDLDVDAERFELLERCASGILAVSAARRTASIGGQFLIDLIPGKRRVDFTKSFGSMLTAVVDHRRAYLAKSSDSIGSIFQSWANVFLMVSEEAISPRDILKTCIEATKSIQIAKSDLRRLLEEMSLIDDYLTSKTAFTPVDSKAPISEFDSLVFCLTLSLMRPDTKDLLDWEYQNHMASEPEFIAAAYLTGLLKPRRKHTLLRDEVVESILIANQISSMKKGLDHLDISIGKSIEVKTNDVLSIKIENQMIAKPYGSSWNIKKTTDQDPTPKENAKLQDLNSVRKLLIEGPIDDYVIKIVDGKLSVWAKASKNIE